MTPRSPRTTHRLVAVDWVDSCGRGGWIPLDEMTCPAMECKSVGFIIKETPRAITLTAHLGFGDKGTANQGHSEFTIPREAIRRVRRLK